MITRNRMCTALAATLAALGVAAAELAPTPAQTRGPFYPRSFPAEHDNDLTRVGDA